MRWQAMHQYYSAAIGRFVQERGMTPGTSAEGLGSTAGDASAGVRDGVSGEEAEPAGASPRIATASSPSAGGSAASAGADSDAPSGAGDIASPVVLEDPRTMAAQLGIPLNSLSMGLSGEGVEEEGWEQVTRGPQHVSWEGRLCGHRKSFQTAVTVVLIRTAAPRWCSPLHMGCCNEFCTVFGSGFVDYPSTSSMLLVQDFGGEEDVRRESMVLIKSYLAWKKAILWDLVLATWPVSETA